jgi:glycosyltransferase involved in cell wall biosynthesis
MSSDMVSSVQGSRLNQRPEGETRATGRKIRVLFMQSQTFFGADTMIHGVIMRNLNRDRLEVHVACTPEDGITPSPPAVAFRRLPDVHFRATNFGPSLNDHSPSALAKELRATVPGTLDLARLAWYVKHNRVDVIHCTEKPRDALYGLVLARATGAKCVVHLHVKYEHWIKPLTRWAIGQADGVIGVSPFVVESAQRGGLRSDRLYSVLNSVDTNRWDCLLDGTAIREEYGIPSGTAIIASISRLFHWKGQAELIRALARIEGRAPGYRLLIVGADDPRGAPGRGSYTAELRALAMELGLSERVIFTGWRSDANQILAACDIFALPSFEEPFGVAFLEAMAMKRPIIALDNGGTPYVVEHGKAGLLSAPGDVPQLGENLLTLLMDPPMRRKMGEYGRQRVTEYFTPRRLADDIEQVYRRVLGRD